MKSLWFKQEFVQPILDGFKRSTLRRSSTRLPAIGDVVAFSVGAREPFAYARVLDMGAPGTLTLYERQGVRAIYGDAPMPTMVRITFELCRRSGKSTS